MKKPYVTTFMKKHLLYFSLVGAILFTISCGSSETNTSGVAQIREADRATAQENAGAASNVQNKATVINAEVDSTENSTAKTDEEIATDFTECMRSEGFELPDPELNADGSVNVEAIRDNLIADPNFNFQSRKTQQSLAECIPLLEGATFAQQPTEEELVEFQDNLLQFAECLRENGLDVPDPDFNDGTNGIRTMLAEVDMTDSKVQATIAKCQSTFTDNEGGGPRGER